MDWLRTTDLTPIGILESCWASAAEAGSVLQNHLYRATSLLASGVTFTRPNPDVREINHFLNQTTELKENDQRSVGVARDARGVDTRGELIGAVVITAAEIRGLRCMFIDVVKVAPTWQNKGLGSVLLVTSQQIMPESPSFTAGHCPSATAPLFALLGFAVLRPGAPLLLPTEDLEVHSMGLPYGDECFFYRQGPF